MCWVIDVTTSYSEGSTKGNKDYNVGYFIRDKIAGGDSFVGVEVHSDLIEACMVVNYLNGGTGERPKTFSIEEYNEVF